MSKLTRVHMTNSLYLRYLLYNGTGYMNNLERNASCLLLLLLFPFCFLFLFVLRDGFKTQPPVDRRFRLVPPGFYCSKQYITVYRCLLTKLNQEPPFCDMLSIASNLSLHFIIRNNHTELQSFRGRRFCSLSWSYFYGTI